MICFRDRTYCISPHCVCGKKLTDKIKAEAANWWVEVTHNELAGDDAPIAVAYFCGGAPNRNEYTEVRTLSLEDLK